MGDSISICSIYGNVLPNGLLVPLTPKIDSSFCRKDNPKTFSKRASASKTQFMHEVRSYLIMRCLPDERESCGTREPIHLKLSFMVHSFCNLLRFSDEA